MCTMTPPPFARKCGTAACEQKNAPPTFTRIIRSNSAGVTSSSEPRQATPVIAALLTKTSRPPNHAAPSSINRLQASGSPISTGNTRTLRPCLSNNESATDTSGWPITTLAPIPTKASVMASPMPVAPPVTTTLSPAPGVDLPLFISGVVILRFFCGLL